MQRNPGASPDPAGLAVMFHHRAGAALDPLLIIHREKGRRGVLIVSQDSPPNTETLNTTSSSRSFFNVVFAPILSLPQRSISPISELLFPPSSSCAGPNCCVNRREGPLDPVPCGFFSRSFLIAARAPGRIHDSICTAACFISGAVFNLN